MKKVVLVLALMCFGFTSCEKETIENEDLSLLPTAKAIKFCNYRLTDAYGTETEYYYEQDQFGKWHQMQITRGETWGSMIGDGSIGESMDKCKKDGFGNWYNN